MTSHFFDIGANIGQSFPEYLNPSTEFDGWNIWLFEPSPRHTGELLRTAKDNADRYKIHVCPFGIRGDQGIIPFFQKDDPRGDSYEDYLESDHKVNNLEEGYRLLVPCAGIVPFILETTEPGDRIILKIDAEGSEYNILTRLLESAEATARVSEILVEWHKVHMAPGDLGTPEIMNICKEREITIRKWNF